jgi:hypothetical protein
MMRCIKNDTCEQVPNQGAIDDDGVSRDEPVSIGISVGGFHPNRGFGDRHLFASEGRKAASPLAGNQKKGPDGFPSGPNLSQDRKIIRRP